MFFLVFLFSIVIYLCLKNFRIFVGTWNVAGRSPIGSLAVDLDDWLNLKDEADMYVLGYVITKINAPKLFISLF